MPSIEKPPRVSVIMPFYNPRPFIEESVESVRAQTYGAWELLLVDDGSTDGSGDVAREFAAADPERIRYLCHPDGGNRGASATRNLGIEAARGEFLAFLDADDVWLPNKLEEQVALLDAVPSAGVLYGNTLFWSSWNGRPEDAGKDFLPPLGVPTKTLLQPPELLIRCVGGKAAVPCTCSILVRRALAREVGGFEERFRRVFTDQAFYAKLFLAAPVYVVDSCWDKYRLHPESSCSTAEREGYLSEARIEYLEWLRSFLELRGVTDSRLAKALRRALWLERHPKVANLTSSLRRTFRGLRQAASRAAANGRHKLPPSTRLRLRRLRHPRGGVRFGNLRRLAPVSRAFGYDRGQPVDRHFIEDFLYRERSAIQGRVLEVGDDSYTRRYGGERVEIRDVLHVHPGNPIATIVGDLATADHIPDDLFDCIILTQTLHLIYDVRAAVRTLHRILRPGGVLLATVPGISQIDRGEWAKTWYWSFTPLSVRAVLAESFSGERVQIESFGNVLTCTAFLQGLAVEELKPRELAFQDPSYPLVITVRAQKDGPEVADR